MKKVYRLDLTGEEPVVTGERTPEEPVIHAPAPASPFQAPTPNPWDGDVVMTDTDGQPVPEATVHLKHPVTSTTHPYPTPTGSPAPDAGHKPDKNKQSGSVGTQASQSEDRGTQKHQEKSNVPKSDRAPSARVTRAQERQARDRRKVEEAKGKAPEGAPTKASKGGGSSGKTLAEVLQVPAKPQTLAEVLQAPAKPVTLRELLGVGGASGKDAGGGADEAHLVDIPDPKSVSEAEQTREWTEWQSAIMEEEASMYSMGVFERMPESEVPKGQTIISTRFLLTSKRDQFGLPYRRKARLVARGFNYESADSVYSPTSGWDSVLTVLSVASRKRYRCRDVDVSTAYLYAPTSEPVYVSPPYGSDDYGQGAVYRLRKSLYGIDSSGKNWYWELRRILVSLGYKPCKSDSAVFVRTRSTYRQIILAYVDDLKLFGRTKYDLDEMERELLQNLKLKKVQSGEYFSSFASLRHVLVLYCNLCIIALGLALLY